MPEPTTMPIEARKAAVTPLEALDASFSLTRASSGSRMVKAGSPSVVLIAAAARVLPRTIADISSVTAVW